MYEAARQRNVNLALRAVVTEGLVLNDADVTASRGVDPVAVGYAVQNGYQITSADAIALATRIESIDPEIRNLREGFLSSGGKLHIPVGASPALERMSRALRSWRGRR